MLVIVDYIVEIREYELAKSVFEVLNYYFWGIKGC